MIEIKQEYISFLSPRDFKNFAKIYLRFFTKRLIQNKIENKILLITFLSKKRKDSSIKKIVRRI